MNRRVATRSRWSRRAGRLVACAHGPPAPSITRMRAESVATGRRHRRFLWSPVADEPRASAIDEHVGDRHSPRRACSLRFSMAVGMVPPHVEAAQPREFFVGEAFGQTQLRENRFRAYDGDELRFDKRRRLVLFFDPSESRLPVGRPAGVLPLTIVDGEYRARQGIERGNYRRCVERRLFAAAPRSASHVGQHPPKSRIGAFVGGRR